MQFEDLIDFLSSRSGTVTKDVMVQFGVPASEALAALNRGYRMGYCTREARSGRFVYWVPTGAPKPERPLNFRPSEVRAKNAVHAAP